MAPCVMPGGMAVGAAHQSAPGPMAMPDAPAPLARPHGQPQHHDPSAPDHDRCNCVASCCSSVVASLPTVLRMAAPAVGPRHGASDQDDQVPRARRSHANYFANTPPPSRSLTIA